jgi:hypothetical protein
LKSWFSNAKTKQQSRKVEPFRAWLAGVKAIKGAPHRIQLPWVLWQDASHSEVLRARYREAYKKEADDEEEEGSPLEAFEKEGDEGEDNDGPTCVQLLHRKFHLAHTYLGELSEEEQEKVRQTREEDYATRRAAHDRLIKGDTACTVEELAE